MAPTPETVSQDPLVRFQADIPDSAHKFVKSQSVLAGKTMGEFLTDLLISHTSYEPPAAKAA